MLRSVALSAALLATAQAQQESRVEYHSVPQPVVEARLRAFKGNDTQREATLKQMFLDAGCPAANLTEMPVSKRKQPNLECVLPGDTDEVVIVGAHFDHVDEGSGVIDNWSGASMLPSLMQGVLGTSHKRSFWFVAFSGEEDGLLGSKAFASAMTPEALSRVTAMVTMDSLGAGPTEVWVSQSDPKLVSLLSGVARLQHLPLAGMNVNGWGVSDEESFIARGVCTVTLHSLTGDTVQLIHSNRDTMNNIRLQEYYGSYQLVLAYLAVLGSMDIPKHTCDVQPLDVNGQPRTRRAPLRSPASVRKTEAAP